MTQGERVKEVRKSFGLTLEKFGEKIGMKKNSISQIENGRNSMTEQVAKSICREFNVSEDWLFNGEGEMFVDENSEYHAMLDNILAGEDEFAKNIFKTFVKLDVEEWRVLRQVIEKYIDVSREEESYDDEDDMRLIADINAIPDTPEELERQFPPVEFNRSDDAG